MRSEYIPNLSNFNGVEAAEIFNHTGGSQQGLDAPMAQRLEYQ